MAPLVNPATRATSSRVARSIPCSAKTLRPASRSIARVSALRLCRTIPMSINDTAKNLRPQGNSQNVNFRYQQVSQMGRGGRLRAPHRPLPRTSSRLPGDERMNVLNRSPAKAVNANSSTCPSAEYVKSAKCGPTFRSMQLTLGIGLDSAEPQSMFFGSARPAPGREADSLELG